MTQGRRLGRYELLGVESTGEILTVYRARDREQNRPVILKMLQAHLIEDKELAAQFRRRAETLLGLDHPYIAPVLDAKFDRDAFYLVTAVPAGELLEYNIPGDHGPSGPGSRREGRREGAMDSRALDVDDVLSIVAQLAEALDYAHEQGVIHHDVRPANIYLHNGTPVLTNFFLLEAPDASPTYMAPELLDETSAEGADRRSDTYSLGVVAYTLLTGKPPFEGTAADVAAAHLTQRPLAPRVHNPDLFPALDAILLKALAKQPQSRYQSAGEFATALREAVQAAQTRRMAAERLFKSPAGAAGDIRYRVPATAGAGGIPAWVWVGIGILLVVVATVIILLATG